jgi:hypothetical protein
VKIYGSLAAALKAHPDAYVSMAMIGNCRICSARQDLRAGVCFGCSGKVDGEKIEGGHRLWEKSNPNNFWYTPEA